MSIYYRENVKFIDIPSLSFQNKHFESLCGKLKCDIGYIYVIVLYRFNYNTNMDSFFENLSELLKMASEQPCIVLGDFNFDTLKCDTSTYVQKYIDSFMCSGFAPLISEPTHFKGDASTSIDQIWCNVISENVFSGILNISTSNHLPVFATIPTSADDMFSHNNSDIDSNTIKIHNLSVKNIEKFEHDLQFLENESSLLTFNCNKSPQHTLDEFNNFYTRLLDIYNSNFNKSWITMGIAKSCKVKNKLHSESIKHRGRAKEQETKMNLYRTVPNSVTSFEKQKVIILASVLIIVKEI